MELAVSSTLYDGPIDIFKINDEKHFQYIKTVPSLSEAAKFTGVQLPHISRYCMGKIRISNGGYTFKYAKRGD